MIVVKNPNTCPFCGQPCNGFSVVKVWDDREVYTDVCDACYLQFTGSFFAGKVIDDVWHYPSHCLVGHEMPKLEGPGFWLKCPECEAGKEAFRLRVQNWAGNGRVVVHQARHPSWEQPVVRKPVVQREERVAQKAYEKS